MVRLVAGIGGCVLGVALDYLLLRGPGHTQAGGEWLLVVPALGLGLVGWALADLRLTRHQDPDS